MEREGHRRQRARRVLRPGLRWVRLTQRLSVPDASLSPMDFSATPALEYAGVHLAPLDPSHAPALSEAVRPGELWKAWYTSVPHPDVMAEEIQRRMGLHAQGLLAPWTVIDADSGDPVGMTTYLHLDPENARLEIGNTWIGQRAQHTGINPAMKFLLLRRAFEDLGCMAVEFRTHWHNHQSRAAIARLGAKQDGVLRNHLVMPNGTRRDTVVFSILDTEWPAVWAGLEHRVERPNGHRVEGVQ